MSEQAVMEAEVPIRDPSELLEKYEQEEYPPSLSEAERMVVRTYLREQGLEARVGAVACGSGPRETLKSLVSTAMAEFGLQNVSAEDIVVGPNSLDSLGTSDAISLYVPVR